ncbi:WD40 repeat-like protein [Amylocystis lapponica]|nr:WD40 repeat-like protein [Amylocystis lapponica]
MPAPLLITADAVNCLIHAYFEDSGFQHSAFVLRAEGRLEHSPYLGKHIPRGELLELLGKALLYTETEAHWQGNVMTNNCTSTFSLLEKHVCSLDSALPPTVTFDSVIPELSKEPLPPPPPPPPPPENGASTLPKKSPTPVPESEVPGEKRTRTTTPDDMDVDSIASSADGKLVKSKPSTSRAGGPPEAKKPRLDLPAGPTDDTDPGVVTLLKGHQKEVFVCAWNPAQHNILASGSRDTVIHIWDIPESLPDEKRKSPVVTLSYTSQVAHGDLTSLDWTQDGTLLSIGSWDSILRICYASGELYFSKAQKQKGAIFATRFSKSGRWLLTASLDGSACVWDVAEKKLHTQFQCHKDRCFDVDWITEDIFASCGADGVIRILSLESSTRSKTLIGHNSEVNQIKCNASCTRLASCSDDSTARLWNIEDIVYSRPPNNDVIVLTGHTHNVSSITWCPITADGEHDILATSSLDGSSRLWDGLTGDCLKVFEDHTQHVYALAFCPDARFFATGGGDGWLHVYDVRTRKKIWSWYAGADRPSIFEIDWQKAGNINRMALGLESHQVGIVDVSRIPLLR